MRTSYVDVGELKTAKYEFVDEEAFVERWIYYWAR